MKSMAAKAGDTKPNLLTMSSDEGDRLLRKAQNVTRGLELLETANVLVKEGVGGGPGGGVAFKMPDRPKFTGINGPIESSLGGVNYSFSAMQGFTGPISKEYRWAWDHVQPGLKMDAMELTTVDRLAVCNDGSPAIMFLKEASRSKWHFHIDGG